MLYSYLVARKTLFLSQTLEKRVLIFLSVINLVFLNEVSFPFEVEIGLFVWKTFPCSNENCFNVDSLQMWHAKMGHNSFSDLTRLPLFVESMKIGDWKIECCEVWDLNKSKKQPVPKIARQEQKNFGHCAYRCLKKNFSWSCRWPLLCHWICG